MVQALLGPVPSQQVEKLADLLCKSGTLLLSTKADILILLLFLLLYPKSKQSLKLTILVESREFSEKYCVFFIKESTNKDLYECLH
jgi:hypothetical protein